MNDTERNWLLRASRRAGSFLSSFADACFHADVSNFAILRPVLTQLMEKYPEYHS